MVIDVGSSIVATVYNEPTNEENVMGPSKQDVIVVDEEEIEVWVTEMSSSRWRVHGTFRGKQIVEHGPSPSSAKSAWQRKADFFAKE